MKFDGTFVSLNFCRRAANFFKLLAQLLLLMTLKNDGCSKKYFLYFYITFA
jgi:hypothetical protein